MKLNIKEKLRNYKRILTIAKKPSTEEFLDTSKVCAIGIALVGVIGFLLYMIAILLGI
jgi:protein transport protein SEC61 subunit gamma-like protein